ncbi:nucleotidyl transferase AbiEii/AbiGii toxin family protein [Hazenella sp. IB182357]|uniref:Nucleotidyl transferase AbiEii/AbiGii toxin family protein n=1 Tax=Polycladospora coralii TaxID=2771432 RepID=A0A926RTX6_9BACL|nr:nucleotidyl transferase AbiEii/AbiGii toxin family protein [Polycladospora coralii]MBD1371699.1 nucleotidyl transferase AbiEii/AbiGii toxin family protein [Polycladospora coralii]MBS7529166.1 nucleotidyl transferase AbiEii/AbiGii toxin family protein [Polycladospora coralii]
MLNEATINKMTYEEKELVGLEALLRRIAIVKMPFMLKGSLLTRQYLADPSTRFVEDIDFLYVGRIKDEEQAHEIFTNWMSQVTELDLGDGIGFENFRKNAFWRRIDYAMAEDFPTINTDLGYFFKAEEHEKGEEDEYEDLHVDISFNIDLGFQPSSLTYQPVFGEKFIVPYAVPLSIQVAWKLHQTIVRPRLKDLYDLKYLLSHSSYDDDARVETLQMLVDECSIDESITPADIKKVLVGDLQGLYDAVTGDYFFNKYAGEQNHKDYFTQLVTELRQLMDRKGINQYAFDHLPEPGLKTVKS